MSDYATKMRMALSDNHVQINGAINHQYFLVKKGQYWSQEMQDALIKSLSEIAIGRWTEMLKGPLSNSNEIELELRTCLILKISDVSQYQGRVLSKNDIDIIAKENLALATANNKLKYGIYVQPSSSLKQNISKEGNKKNPNRQIFRIQNAKLSPQFKGNFSQLPNENSLQGLQQKLADSSAMIKSLQMQVSELTKQNESLDSRLKKANATIADYWVKAKDSQKDMQICQQRLQVITNKYKVCRDKKKMYKRRIIDSLNYFYGRYTDAQQQNAPFLQLEELRQVLLALGMHESIIQEMEQLNQQDQQMNVDNMTYEQLLALQERIGNQQAGLTVEQIKKLPKGIKEESEQIDLCTVCYEGIDTGHKYRSLPCNHHYHSKCIKAWLLNHKKCPVCNIEVQI